MLFVEVANDADERARDECESYSRRVCLHLKRRTAAATVKNDV